MRRAGSVVPLAVAVLSAFALGAAWYAERVLGLVPCALCLLERWPYRVAIILGLLAAALPRGPANIVRAFLMIALLAGAGLGVTHVGVEQGWWPSPLPECHAPAFRGGSFAERLAAMPARPAKPCDEPTYLIPGLPVSMAAMGLALSLALAAAVAISWPKGKRLTGRSA
jgi:disulfide bond formation protein DsbB